MQRLLELLKRHGSLLYLLLLQVVGLRLLVTYNTRHTSAFDSAFLGVSGYIEVARNNLQSHFSRSEQNTKLQQENLRLQSRVQELENTLSTYRYSVPYLPGRSPLPDSLVPRIDYRYIPCRAIYNGVSSNFNYLTLNVGSKQGIRPEMGIISTEGIVGMTVAVSENFSRAISLLNKDFRLSARVRGKGVFGSFTWEGGSPLMGQLEHVPLHFEITPGDTVEASGFSTLFPEGTLVGVVARVTPNETEGFHQVDVRLATDFYQLDYLYVIDPLHAPELDTLVALKRSGT